VSVPHCAGKSFTAIHTVLRSLMSPFRVSLFTTLLGGDILINDFATVRAISHRGVLGQRFFESQAPPQAVFYSMDSELCESLRRSLPRRPPCALDSRSPEAGTAASSPRFSTAAGRSVNCSPPSRGRPERGSSLPGCGIGASHPTRTLPRILVSGRSTIQLLPLKNRR
jgi:hypothetical protein